MKNEETKSMSALLLKKARKKYLSQVLARALVTIPSSLNKQYYSTFACSSQIIIDANYNMTSVYYCKRRWCQTCASINMATMINNYVASLSQYKSLYFVTLTRRSVKAYEVEQTIDEMQKNWRKMTDLARKRGVSLNGVRKLELKVGKGGGYHPHYHILVDTEDSARYLIERWLYLNPTSTSNLAQDMRQVNNLENAVVEIMKYATKLTCSEDSSNQVLCTPTQMNVIFESLHRKRLFQPFGSLKVAREEDAYNIQAQEIRKAHGLYEWIGHDWFHSVYGHALSNYVPDADDMSIKAVINRG